MPKGPVALPLPQRSMVAAKVHALLKAPSWALKHDDLEIDVYENGREHGFRLFVAARDRDMRVEICFSEYRNSDDIVVYVSVPGERFEGEGGIPTDRAYAAKKFFRYDEIVRAAAYIQAVIDRVLDGAEAGK